MSQENHINILAKHSGVFLQICYCNLYKIKPHDIKNSYLRIAAKISYLLKGHFNKLKLNLIRHDTEASPA